MLTSEFIGRPKERIIAQRFLWDRARYDGWWQTQYVGVVLVQQGKAQLSEPHLPPQSIDAGAVILLAPRKAFRIEPEEGTGLTICRCQIRPRWAEGIRQQFAHIIGESPWSAGPMASLVYRPPNLYDWLLESLVNFAAQPPDELGAQAFLLGLLDRWRAIKKPVTQLNDLPAWLSEALTQMTQRKYLKGGVHALAALCGRSLHHVNACCRKYLKQTATAVVNQLRMEYAARHLRLSDASCEEIAQQCGIANRPYFTKLFRHYYGVTPGAYRRGS